MPKEVVVNVKLSETLRISIPDGSVVSVKAADVVDYIRKEHGLPHLRPVSEKKSCPNHKCTGGWAPDALKTGEAKCPVCGKTWYFTNTGVDGVT